LYFLKFDALKSWNNWKRVIRLAHPKQYRAPALNRPSCCCFKLAQGQSGSIVQSLCTCPTVLTRRCFRRTAPTASPGADLAAPGSRPHVRCHSILILAPPKLAKAPHLSTSRGPARSSALADTAKCHCSSRHRCADHHPSSYTMASPSKPPPRLQ
jgi:hypothetical protein